MHFHASITEDILRESLPCGTEGKPTSQNCAFALLYNQLVPHVQVSRTWINFFDKDWLLMHRVCVTDAQLNYILLFDRTPAPQRMTLPLASFTLEIPDAVIEYWHGDAVKAAQKLIDNPVLKVVEVI